MADIRQPKFWTSLLQKILNQILKNLGVNTRRKSNIQHIVPHEEGWAIKGEGNERYTGVYQYQEDAIDRAKDIAQNYGSSIVIHRKDGSIRDRISYKN